MTPVARLSRFFKHLVTFFLHFAHGGLVMVGVIVIALTGYQFIQFGSDGLNPRAMFGYAPVAEKVQEVVVNDAAEPESEAREAHEVKTASGVPAGYQRVATAIAKRHKVSPVVVETLVKAAVKEGHANGVDPMLILAVITVESRFNPFAESAFGAQGLMQIIPRFHVEKISASKGKSALFDPLENIRVGTLILKSYIRSTGSIAAGLQMYGGASSDPQRAYSTKVQMELERLRSVKQPASLRTANRSTGAPQA